MRELTINELSLVTGAADDQTTKDVRSAIIGAAVSYGVELTASQIDSYVQAYKDNGMTGVLLNMPGVQVFLTTSMLFAGATGGNNETTPPDGNDYCEDGGNY